VLQVVEESRRNVSHGAPRQVRRDAMLHPRSRRLHHRSRPKQIRLQVRVEVANGKVVVITIGYIILAQDLRAYRDLGGLSKAIQDATQQLAMLNMVNEQQKQAIAILVDLKKAGMTATTTTVSTRWEN
jgi:hypothetical protein